MSSSIRSTGAALATAAALLFSTVAVNVARAEEATVHCMGVNSCKGTSACKTASNACKGQNSCKVQGFVEMTQAVSAFKNVAADIVTIELPTIRETDWSECH